jgi:hypothetical protein
VIERRKTTRYDFGAIAQVTDLDSGEEIIAVTRDLSHSGCFIRTVGPFAKGSTVLVRIRWCDADFAARGEVTDNICREGMGIAFTEISCRDGEIIDQWLDPRPRPRQQTGIPVIVFGGEGSGNFMEETESHVTSLNRALLRLSSAVVPGQMVRVRNRLTREERRWRVISVPPNSERHKSKLLTVEILESVPSSWNSQNQVRQ